MTVSPHFPVVRRGSTPPLLFYSDFGCARVERLLPCCPSNTKFSFMMIICRHQRPWWVDSREIILDPVYGVTQLKAFESKEAAFLGRRHSTLGQILYPCVFLDPWGFQGMNLNQGLISGMSCALQYFPPYSSITYVSLTDPWWTDPWSHLCVHMWH